MKEEKNIEITLDRLGRIELFSLIINTLSKLKFNSSIRKSFTDSSVDGKTIGLTFTSYDDGTFEIMEGESVEIPLATTTTAGVMSAADKQTLEELKQQMSNINLILEYIINS